MNTHGMHEVLAETQAGKLIFPEVVRRLLEVDVESCFCNLATGEETFYTRDGQTHVEKMTLPLAPVAEQFSLPGVIAAIRGAQTDTIRYPEFVKRAAAAVSSPTGPFSPARECSTLAVKANSTSRNFRARILSSGTSTRFSR